MPIPLEIFEIYKGIWNLIFNFIVYSSVADPIKQIETISAPGISDQSLLSVQPTIPSALYLAVLQIYPILKI
jgi:hypothetical protein